MPVASLQSMALALCKRHIHDIDDLGEMPFKTVEPILRHITSPEQLLEVQTKSPHLAEHTEDLWIAFIKRDVPSWEKNRIVPKNKASWCKVYRKVKKEDDELKEQQHQDLKKAMMEHATRNQNEGFCILPTVLTSADDISRRRGIRKPLAGGATSAAMQKFRKETAKIRSTYGPIHQGRASIGVSSQQAFARRASKGTRAVESQGARELDEYLRQNQAELELKNERLKQIRASKYNNKQSPRTSPPPYQARSPVRGPRSSTNSPASTATNSTKSTPVMKPTPTEKPIPKLDLTAHQLVPKASASLSSKLSLQAYTMRRKASASEQLPNKRIRMN